MKILVIDVGGTNLKVCVTGRKEALKIRSGPKMNAAGMVKAVKKAVAGWDFDVVSIGYPGAVVDGAPAVEPRNLAHGWVRYDFGKAFGRPVRIVNDAAMQALGGYKRGRMLFLGLGTGLGSALVADGHVAPLELAHLPYRKGRTYEDYAGMRGLQRLGRKRWTQHVIKIAALLRFGLQAHEVVLGGGQTEALTSVPDDLRIGSNANAILGGYRLWDDESGSKATGKKPSR